jgi:hypothetical protein
MEPYYGGPLARREVGAVAPSSPRRAYWPLATFQRTTTPVPSESHTAATSSARFTARTLADDETRGRAGGRVATHGDRVEVVTLRSTK